MVGIHRAAVTLKKAKFSPFSECIPQCPAAVRFVCRHLETKERDRMEQHDLNSLQALLVNRLAEKALGDMSVDELTQCLHEVARIERPPLTLVPHEE